MSIDVHAELVKFVVSKTYYFIHFPCQNWQWHKALI